MLRAGLAHLWFVTIHPFDDGNGRIARAIADLALARSEQSPRRFYSMSAQIQQERTAYYDILEQTHNREAHGVLVQIERLAARCSAAISVLAIGPMLAWWKAAGYPYPGPEFWTAEAVIGAMGVVCGWIIATAIVARRLIGKILGAILGWCVLLIAGCLLAAWLAPRF